VRRSKGLQFRINTTDLTPELIGSHEDLCREFAGNTPLYMKVRDEQENISLELLSRKFRVNPINDMVKKAKKIADIEVVF
jgi:DNA polymerase-3 subunit alpha